MKEKERIEKDAEIWADTEQGQFWYDMGQKGLEQCYIAGATVEHTRAWNDAIDACKGSILFSSDMPDINPNHIEFIVNKLEKLKR